MLVGARPPSVEHDKPGARRQSADQRGGFLRHPILGASGTALDEFARRQLDPQAAAGMDRPLQIALDKKPVGPAFSRPTQWIEMRMRAPDQPSGVSGTGRRPPVFGASGDHIFSIL